MACKVLFGLEFQCFCTLLVLRLQPSNDAHQGFALAFHRRDPPGLSTLLIKENQSGPVETLCTVFAFPRSRHQIQDTLLCCAIGVVIRRRDSQGSSTIFIWRQKKTPWCSTSRGPCIRLTHVDQLCISDLHQCSPGQPLLDRCKDRTN